MHRRCRRRRSRRGSLCTGPNLRAARASRTYRHCRHHQDPTYTAGPPQAATRTRPVHGPTARYRNLCHLAQLARTRRAKRSRYWSGQPSGPCSLITGGVRYNPSHEAQESARHSPRGGGGAGRPDAVAGAAIRGTAAGQHCDWRRGDVADGRIPIPLASLPSEDT